MTHEDGSLSTPKGGDPAELVNTNRANGGADPVHGRMYYGTSHAPPDRLRSRRIGSGRQTVYQHFGPFNDSVGRGRQTYIYIYNDPGH
ncbi:MAG: hypothetical protein ACREBW_00985 [Candidatus Micrarchaeaceae archaeon]